MVEVKVTCDRCKKQIRLDRENFFQVTVQQKDVKPDGTIFPIDQWSRVICEDCQAVLDSPDAEEREETGSSRKRGSCTGATQKEGGSGSRECSFAKGMESGKDRREYGRISVSDQPDREEI